MTCSGPRQIVLIMPLFWHRSFLALATTCFVWLVMHLVPSQQITRWLCSDTLKWIHVVQYIWHKNVVRTVGYKSKKCSCNVSENASEQLLIRVRVDNTSFKVNNFSVLTQYLASALVQPHNATSQVLQLQNIETRDQNRNPIYLGTDFIVWFDINELKWHQCRPYVNLEVCDFIFTFYSSHWVLENPMDDIVDAWNLADAKWCPWKQHHNWSQE